MGYQDEYPYTGPVFAMSGANASGDWTGTLQSFISQALGLPSQAEGTGGTERRGEFEDIIRDAFGMSNITDPAEFMNILAPPTVPGVSAPGAENAAAVEVEAGKARTKAQQAATGQQEEGALAAAEIAAAKGKSSGSGAQNIAKGISQEADQNLQDLLNQILGTETQAKQDVQNLGAVNQDLFDEYATQIAEMASQNQAAYSTIFNEQSGLFGQAQNDAMTSAMDLINNTQWSGAADAPMIQDPNDPNNPDAKIPDPAGYTAPQFGGIQYDASFAQPEYADFASLGLPDYGSADLNPYLEQFDTFELGDLASLGGEINQGAGGPEGRGGRGQWNIPGYDQGAQYQDDDWLQQLMASMGQGGLF